MSQPKRILVYSSLFPSSAQPQAGIFIRERMFRVAEVCPIVVVSPVPWFPLQGLIRVFRPHYRPSVPRHEIQEGIDVYHPRFLAVPGLFRRMDGPMMAWSTRRLVRRLRNEGVDIIDAHFGYPDGYAAVRLGKWLGLPVTITLRGTEPRHGQTEGIRDHLCTALHGASALIAVSTSLLQTAVDLGVNKEKITVVGNGVDVNKFYPVDGTNTRGQLGIRSDAKVLVTVGGLCERKGFHRVIECLPSLRRKWSDLHYLIVGGPSAEGDWTGRLRQMVSELQLQDSVHFLGSVAQDELRNVLSAADTFVLATRNEGWANVILEAMACGLPVVATDVGGNREVVASEAVGSVVPFGDSAALEVSIDAALSKQWDRDAIIDYARKNSWGKRMHALQEVYDRVLHNFSKSIQHQ